MKSKREEVIQEAQREQRTVHFATLIDICHLKIVEISEFQRPGCAPKRHSDSEKRFWLLCNVQRAAFVCVANDGRISNVLPQGWGPQGIYVNNRWRRARDRPEHACVRSPQLPRWHMRWVKTWYGDGNSHFSLPNSQTLTAAVRGCASVAGEIGENDQSSGEIGGSSPWTHRLPDVVTHPRLERVHSRSAVVDQGNSALGSLLIGSPTGHYSTTGDGSMYSQTCVRAARAVERKRVRSSVAARDRWH